MTFTAFFSDKIFQLILITLLPYIELRGAIPWGIYSGLNPFLVFFVCVLTNILLIPFVFVFLDLVFSFFEKFPFIRKQLDSLHSRTNPFVQKYGFFGLMVFVAIPLPLTGAYSGTLASKLLGIPKKEAFLSVALGVILAGIMITLLSVGILSVGFASLGLSK
ncbi:MAG: small multi-drug export protein [archaeon]